MEAVARITILACGLLLACQPASLGAQAPPAASRNVPGATASNLTDRHAWADELFFQQWRIQRHAQSGLCRLLDERDQCQASGSWEQCQQALEQAKRDRNLPPMRGPAVLLLHGLFRSRSCMQPLDDYLEKQGGFLVLNVEYPSTQADVTEHARALGSIVRHLEGVSEIHLVGHSLGNIIIRRWLADQAQETTPATNAPRLGRIVMLGPPNQGAELATLVADEPLVRRLVGPVGQQLGSQWPWLEITLATPPGEFGIIAGGLQNGHGFNPLLPGDDDGTVTVESTRLEGAQDFLIVPVIHSLMMSNHRVQEQTLMFLREGHFGDSSR